MFYIIRYVLATMLSLIVFVLGCYYFVMPLAKTHTALLFKKNELSQKLDQLLTHNKQNKNSINGETSSLPQALIEFVISQGLEIKSINMKGDKTDQLDLIIEGKCDNWNKFFYDWQVKSFTSTIQLFELEKNIENFSGKLSVSWHVENKIKTQQPSAKIRHRHLICVDDRKAMMNQTDIAMRSFFTLHIVGHVKSNALEGMFLAWPDGRTVLLKKGDTCCSEKARVIKIDKDGLSFQDKNGRIIKKVMS